MVFTYKCTGSLKPKSSIKEFKTKKGIKKVKRYDFGITCKFVKKDEYKPKKSNKNINKNNNKNE